MSDHEWSDSDRDSPAPSSGTGQKRPRHTTGCHTCRVRRKRCDEQFGPDGCDTCRRLHIECIPSSGHRRRPEWLRDPRIRDDMRARLKEFLKSSVRPGMVTPDIRDGVPFLYLHPESIKRQRGIRVSMHRHSASQPAYIASPNAGGQHIRPDAAEPTQAINLPQLLPTSHMTARSQTPQPFHGHVAGFAHLNARSQTPQSFHGGTTQSSSWDQGYQNWNVNQQGANYGNISMMGNTTPFDLPAVGNPMNFATSGYSGDMFMSSDHGTGNTNYMSTHLAAYPPPQQNAASYNPAAGMVQPDIWNMGSVPVSLDPTMIEYRSEPYSYSQVNSSQAQHDEYYSQFNPQTRSRSNFDPSTSSSHAPQYQ